MLDTYVHHSEWSLGYIVLINLIVYNIYVSIYSWIRWTQVEKTVAVIA